MNRNGEFCCKYVFTGCENTYSQVVNTDFRGRKYGFTEKVSLQHFGHHTRRPDQAFLPDLGIVSMAHVVIIP